MQPQKSDSPSNAKQLSNEATDEQVHQNGCFPSVDVLRKHSDEVKPLYFTLTQVSTPIIVWDIDLTFNYLVDTIQSTGT